MNFFRFCPLPFKDLTPDQEAGSAVRASPGCLLVSMLEFDRTQRPVESKKQQRKYKTLGSSSFFLPGEDIPYCHKRPQEHRTGQAISSGHHMKHEA